MKTNRSTASLLVLLSCLSLAPREAAAWDPDTHLQLARMALAICPAIGSRMPAAADRENAASAAREPDPYDYKCKFHTGGPGSKDPAVLAEQLYKQLISGKGLERPFARAQAIGRYVHYVADTAVPPALIGENKQNPLGMWSNTDYVVFREKTGLTLPLAAGLRKASEPARWGDQTSSANTVAFRVAANLIADALLLIPPVGPDSGPDVGEVILAIDKAEGPSTVEMHQAANRTPNAPGRSAPPTDRFLDNTQNMKVYLPDRQGVQVVEWNEKVSEGKARVRALLMNNSNDCVDEITIVHDDDKEWRTTMQPNVAPHALKVVEIDAPPGIVLAKLRTSSKTHACNGPFSPDMGAPGKTRKIVAATGKAPNPQDAVIR